MKLTSVSINPAGATVVASVSVELSSMKDALAFVNGIYNGQGVSVKEASAPVAVPPAAAPKAAAAPPKSPAPVAAPAAPQAAAAPPVPVPTKHTVKSEYGEITVTQQPGKKVIATLGTQSYGGNTEDDAIGGLLDLLESQGAPKTTAALAAAPAAPKAPVAAAKPAPAVAAAAAPAGDGPPADLVAATSFRHVIEWFLANKIADEPTIVQYCAAWKDLVPAIARLSGDIAARVQRAVYVITQEKAGGATAVN